MITKTKVKAIEAIGKTIGVTIKTNNRVITHSIGTISKIDNLNREVTKFKGENYLNYYQKSFIGCHIWPTKISSYERLNPSTLYNII
jgi:hypothetical protein